MSKIRISLWRKLTRSILLMAVPIFVLSVGIFYLQSRYLIRQEAMARSNSIVRSIIQRVSNYMYSIEASTKANAWLLEDNFCPDSLVSISQRVARLNPHILSCSVITAPDMFPKYVNTGKAGWVEPFDGHTEGTIDYNEAVATYCHPLRSKSGQIIGVIATDLSFSHLAKTINDAPLPYPNAYFVLTGDDGRFFIHPDTTQLFRKTIFTDADPRQDADRIALGYEMGKGRQGTMHIDINGTLCHVSYHPVPGTDWSLALVCPENEVLADYRQLGYVIAALIIIGLLTIVWLCHHEVRQTISPINQLLDTTRRFVDGNYDESIPLSTQNDDVGQLQNAFAAMQQALYNHMGRIRQTTETLRKRNEQRARDIELAQEAVRKKTVFIQNLSHQIRMPLNIITGFADMLNDTIARQSKSNAALSTAEEENLIDMAGMMKYNALHLKSMIIMLLDSSSPTGDEKLITNRSEEVSCNEVARECIDYTVGHFPLLKVNFETELSDDVHILTNRLYLMRSIRELLYNAAKYSDGENVSLHVSQNNTYVLFIVQDVGPGLSDQAEELIFKPFVKIDNLSEGLGLGLPLTKRHALFLGGDLIYDETYHEGCRFIIEMPK